MVHGKLIVPAHDTTESKVDAKVDANSEVPEAGVYPLSFGRKTSLNTHRSSSDDPSASTQTSRAGCHQEDDDHLVPMHSEVVSMCVLGKDETSRGINHQRPCACLALLTHALRLFVDTNTP